MSAIDAAVLAELSRVYQSMLANFPGFQIKPTEEAQFVTWVNDLDPTAVGRAVDALLAANPSRPPNGPAVRRAVVAKERLLAPTWDEALEQLAAVRAGRLDAACLLPIVAEADVFRVAAGGERSAQGAYERAATEWDERVLTSSGMAHVEEARRARELRRLRAQARQCAGSLGLAPKEDYSWGEAEALVARFEAVRPGEELPELARVVAPDAERAVSDGPAPAAVWSRVITQARSTVRAPCRSPFKPGREMVAGPRPVLDDVGEGADVRRLRHADGPSRLGDGLDQRARKG